AEGRARASASSPSVASEAMVGWAVVRHAPTHTCHENTARVDDRRRNEIESRRSARGGGIMTKRTIGIFMVLTAVSGLAATTPTSQSADPWVGTWKVNLAKSTYSPGPKPQTAGTVKIEAVQDGFKTTIDGVNAQGQPTHTEAT